MEVGIDFLTDHVWQNWEGVFERTKKSYEGDIESLGMDRKIAEQKMLNYKRESDGKDSEIYELTRKRDSHEQELLTLQMDVQYLSGQKLRESELAEDRYQ
jgi:chromosome segregation ATPase